LKGVFVKRTVMFVVLTAVLLLGLCGTVFAASPQDIWNDYQADGDLDGKYTNAELNAYLNNATLHQYPPDATKIATLDTLVRGMLTSRSRFPFTGAEITFMVLGVFAVLGAGVGLRRLARARA
jgi:hypothetical protein